MVIFVCSIHRLETTSQHVSSLYHAANLWQVHKVRTACGTHLLDNMNWSNCIGKKASYCMDAVKICQSYVREPIGMMENIHSAENQEMCAGRWLSL